MISCKKLSVQYVFPAGMVLAVLLTACSPAVRQDERIRQVEDHLLLNQTIEERMAFHQVPGLSLAVVNDFELDWAGGYGVLDVRGQEPVEEDTIFQAASISKPVTAVAALHFVEAGDIQLSEDVNDKLVSWKIPENDFTARANVTLHGLLSHTGGINQGLYKGYLPSEDIPTLVEVLDGLPPANSSPVRVDRQPGSEEYYSNGGYLITALLLQDLAGQSFPDLMEETIFSPLGMTSSSFEQQLPEDLQQRTATAHGWDVENWVPSPGIPGEEKWRITDPGCSGLWTTAPDLALFAAEIMKAYQGESDLMINQESARSMFEPVWEDIPLQQPFDSSQALGFSLIELGNTTYWIHFGGAFPGYISALLADPETGFGLVVMTNEWGGGYEIIWELIYRVLYVYRKLPSTPQVLQLAFSLIVFLVGIAWFVRYLIRLGAVGLDQKPTRRTGEMVVLALTLMSLLVLSILYQGPFAGVMVQDGGNSILSKALLGVFFNTPLILLVINILVWTKKRWTRRERVQYGLATLMLIIGVVWAADLWPLMFWG